MCLCRMYCNPFTPGANRGMVIITAVRRLNDDENELVLAQGTPYASDKYVRTGKKIGTEICEAAGNSKVGPGSHSMHHEYVR